MKTKILATVLFSVLCWGQGIPRPGKNWLCTIGTPTNCSHWEKWNSDEGLSPQPTPVPRPNQGGSLTFTTTDPELFKPHPHQEIWIYLTNPGEQAKLSMDGIGTDTPYLTMGNWRCAYVAKEWICYKIGKGATKMTSPSPSDIQRARELAKELVYSVSKWRGMSPRFMTAMVSKWAEKIASYASSIQESEKAQHVKEIDFLIRAMTEKLADRDKRIRELESQLSQQQK